MLQHQLEDCEALDVWLKKKADEEIAKKVQDDLSKDSCAALGEEESVSLLTDLQASPSQKHEDSPDNNPTDTPMDSH